MSLKIAGFDVGLVDAVPPEDPRAGIYSPLKPGNQLLKKGYRKGPGLAPFEVDTILEKDIEVPMRDGVKLRADVFRPADAAKVPTLVVWSPYGKSGNGAHGLDMMEGRFGVPADRLSGFEKFEGIDPADWVAQGYAVVNFDSRGAWDSEGTVAWLGDQDGQDGYDAIEYVASLSWSDGKIAMAGNSWLAMSQWFIAAQQPPHLVCIAPWEGASDLFRDTMVRGGIPYPYYLFWDVIQNTMVGRGKVEAGSQMIWSHPLYDAYWEDKRAKLDKINIPAYVLASYSSNLHNPGSIRGFNSISTKNKWLRIHPRQEWSDLYDQENTTDLRRFFDHFLKGADNGWESTPPVRVSLLRYNKSPIYNVPATQYPVSKAKKQKLYLSSPGNLDTTPTASPNKESYLSDVIPNGKCNDPEELSFLYRFGKPTWLVGYSKAVLFVSADVARDLDVFVIINKLDADGNVLTHLNVPLDQLVPPKASESEVSQTCLLKYTGPTGQLRASHASTLFYSSNTDGWPEYRSDSKTSINPGTIVKLEVPIWPAGIAFDAGESLKLKVSGHFMSLLEFPFLAGKTITQNEGRHNLYYGGEHESYLEVPLAEPEAL